MTALTKQKESYDQAANMNLTNVNKIFHTYH